MYDVYHLSENKRVWIRFALRRPLSSARQIARSVSQTCAVWIRPHRIGEGTIIPTRLT